MGMEITDTAQAMKRFFFVLWSGVLFISCNVNVITGDISTNDSASVFTATIEDNVSRVYIDRELKSHWTEDDRISIFSSTANRQYKFCGETGDVEGNFFEIDTSACSGDEVPTNYAVYPYNPSTSITSSGTISMILPANQSYAENSFGLGSNSMVATTSSLSSKSLYFRNLCGFLVLDLYGQGTVKSIILSGNDGERIAGKAIISPSCETNPEVNVTNEGDKIIALDCGEGITLNRNEKSPVSFWFCVPPVSFDKGFTVQINPVVGDSVTKAVSLSRKIQRNVVNRMEPLELEFPLAALSFKNVKEVMTEGDSRNLELTVIPSSIPDTSLLWQSSDTSVVSVENGLATARGMGIATVSASVNGCSATCRVLVFGGKVTPVPSTGGSVTISFPSDSDWEASPNSDWIDVTPTSGKKGISQIVASCQANVTSDYRESSITIIGQDFSFDIPVVQNDVFSCDTQSISIEKSGGVFDLDFSTNLKFTVTSDCDWIQIPDMANADGHYSIKINKNDSWDRDGTVIITATGASSYMRRIKVHQDGSLYVSYYPYYILSSEGETITINNYVNTNCFKTSSSIVVKWINNGKCDPNNSEYTRTCYGSIYVGPEKRKLERNFLQMPRGVLSPTQKSHTCDYRAAILSVGLPDSSQFVVTSNSSWINVGELNTDMYGLNGEKYFVRYLSINENIGSRNRSAIVTFSDNKYGFVYKLTITQSGKTDADASDWKQSRFVYSLFGVGQCILPDTNNSMFSNDAERLENFKDDCDRNRSNFANVFTVAKNLTFNGATDYIKYLGITQGQILVDYRNIYNGSLVYYEAKEQFYGTLSGCSFSSSVNGDNLDINLSLYFKKAGDYKTVIMLIEDNVFHRVVQTMMGFTNNIDLTLDDVMRKFITPMDGDSITVESDNSIKYFKYSTAIPDKCDRENLKVLVLCLRKYNGSIMSGDGGYGDWYVDNSTCGRIGREIPLRLEKSKDAEGNTGDLNDGGIINVY